MKDTAFAVEQGAGRNHDAFGWRVRPESGLLRHHDGPDSNQNEWQELCGAHS
jgi:hypothetical protein